MHSSGASDGDFPVAIDDVGSDSVVRCQRGVLRGRFDRCVVSLLRGVASERSVRALLVVDDAEPIELVLEVGDGVGGRLFSEPEFECLMEAFDLALGLRMVGVAVFLRDAQARQQVFERVLPAGETSRVDGAIVSQGRRGRPVFVDVGGEVIRPGFRS
ncbi:hypothetical protein ASC63_08540 [Leifsonia sp. Root112D2]|nr:hypothetical protein ASC63_08540 [Leifsonia sp. Root112D2]